MTQMPSTQNQVDELKVEVARLRDDLRQLSKIVLNLKTTHRMKEPAQ